MFNNRVLAVLKRELRERVLTKSFIIGTLAFPLIMVGVIALQYIMRKFDDDKGVKLRVLTESVDLQNTIRNSFDKQEWVKDTSYVISYDLLADGDIGSYINENKSQVLDNEISGILFIPDSAKLNKEVAYYSKNAKNIAMERKLGRVINQLLIDNYFKDKDVSSEDIRFARNSVDFTIFKVTEDKAEEENAGSLVLAYLFGILLYVGLLTMGSVALQTAIEEKSNRVVEVLLSSVNTKELMAGKIVGSTLTGLLQMFIWLIPVFVVAGTTLPFLPPEIAINMSVTQIAYFFVNFIIGLIIYIGLFATVGSIFDNMQDAQSAMFPLMMLIMIPFFMTFTMLENPDNTVGMYGSMAPFLSIIVMPVRMTLIDVPLIQILIALVVNVLTVFVMFPFAGKIYRVGILKTGKKPSWGEVVKWLKYKN
ncbi:MAG: ABC transporter permease [Rhodothermaceae bacterium]